jgi:hypothetical protein
MKLFSKISQGATKLFNKVTSDPNFMRKVSNTARKVDNSVMRVGDFLANTANTLGFAPIGSAIRGGASAVHAIRNDLEKTIRAPMGEVRSHYA